MEFTQGVKKNVFKKMFYLGPKFIKRITREARLDFDKSSIIFSKKEGKVYFGSIWSKKDKFPSLFVLRDNAKLTLIDNFRIYSGAKIYVNKGAHLVLGSGYINHNVNISCFERIEIGENVAISENVTIRDSDNHEIMTNGESKQKTQPVKIGNKVWIGLNVTILKGVTIGDGAVIAAGSVVVGDVFPNTLVAGVPAKVVKSEIHWK